MLCTGPSKTGEWCAMLVDGYAAMMRDMAMFDNLVTASSPAASMPKRDAKVVDEDDAPTWASFLERHSAAKEFTKKVSRHVLSGMFDSIASSLSLSLSLFLSF